MSWEENDELYLEMLHTACSLLFSRGVTWPHLYLNIGQDDLHLILTILGGKEVYNWGFTTAKNTFVFFCFPQTSIPWSKTTFCIFNVLVLFHFQVRKCCSFFPDGMMEFIMHVDARSKTKKTVINKNRIVFHQCNSGGSHRTTHFLTRYMTKNFNMDKICR